MMKSVLLTVCLVLISTVISAQDFTSRFLQDKEADKNLKCVSISPKMMGEVMKIQTSEDNDEILKIISDLKSMQIVTAGSEGRRYYEEAVDILEKNSNRFEDFVSYNDESGDFRIMVRRKRKFILELIMLSNKGDEFVVVNFTGKMNDKFIKRLATSMDLKAIK